MDFADEARALAATLDSHATGGGFMFDEARAIPLLEAALADLASRSLAESRREGVMSIVEPLAELARAVEARDVGDDFTRRVMSIPASAPRRWPWYAFDLHSDERGTADNGTP